jgi:hypothetical protein
MGRGSELNIEKQDPKCPGLHWSPGTAFHPLAGAKGIPVLEPVVVGDGSIDVYCCSDSRDDQKGRHTRTS